MECWRRGGRKKKGEKAPLKKMQRVGTDTKEKGRLLVLIKVSHPPAPYSRLITDCGTEYQWASAASHFTPQPVQPFLFPFIARKRLGGRAGPALDDYRVLLRDSSLKIAVSPINSGDVFSGAKDILEFHKRRGFHVTDACCVRDATDKTLNTLCGSRICNIIFLAKISTRRQVTRFTCDNMSELLSRTPQWSKKEQGHEDRFNHFFNNILIL